jgi:hypothetical protein
MTCPLKWSKLGTTGHARYLDKWIRWSWYLGGKFWWWSWPSVAWMGSLLGNGSLRRRLLQSMVSPTVIWQLVSLPCVWIGSQPRHNDEGIPRGTLWKDKRITLTGPMMVACQWNYGQPEVSLTRIHYMVYLESMCGPQLVRTKSWADGDRDHKRRTKSSPIGPAEQEDGGSL